MKRVAERTRPTVAAAHRSLPAIESGVDPSPPKASDALVRPASDRTPKSNKAHADAPSHGLLRARHPTKEADSPR